MSKINFPCGGWFAGDFQGGSGIPCKNKDCNYCSDPWDYIHCRSYLMINELAYERAKEIAERKEEILEAFVAKYGYQPDEMILCDQPSTGKFWIEKRSNWISVEEKLPNDFSNVFVWFSGMYGEPKIVFFREGDFYPNSFSSEYITKWVKYWMPLPNPPEEN